MNEMEQRKAAKEFAEKWKGKGDEKQHTSQFWSDLLHRVYGIKDFSDRVEFEKRVPLLHTSFIDVYIPETKVVIEQKSQDVDLQKRKKQSDGSELNPFEQAQRYGGKLPYSERPRWIVTCNFQKFLIYDMEEVRPEEKPIEILLEDLPEKYHLLSFLLDATVKKITVEQQLSFKAGELVGKLYDLMLPQYKDPTSESTLQALNKFCVRIVFCLYAEDALLFGPQGNEFYNYLMSFLPENRRKALIALFRILDQPEENRDPYEDRKLLDFPYVNGGLFAGDIEIPQMTDEIMKLILEEMSEKLDWSKISPTIFGAVFESTLNPETRRSGGMHYTSIRDIHKVIDPLFLDDLQNDFDKIMDNPNLSKPKRKAALETFHDRLTKLYFLDPACGSGNFLTETFLSLRRLENKVIEQLQRGLMVLEFANPVKVSIGQFAGIEINDFAVTVARTALWIAESQMIKETEAIVNQTIEFFPLKTDAKIVEGNALRMDWNNVVSKYSCNYIMGNPPFVGQHIRTSCQSDDMSNIFGKGAIETKLDYVICWYKKSAEYMQGTRIKTAFVSTNSICQGEAVPTFWKLMNDLGVIINFAYKTFVWNSEANNKAHVHCVIVGFSLENNLKAKYIYEDDKIYSCDHINGYLLPANDIWIENRTNKPKNGLPKMTTGSPPTDDGGLLMEKAEKDYFLNHYPILGKYIKPFIGAKEFLHDNIGDFSRYCFWFKNGNPKDYVNIKEIKDRLLKVANLRQNSNADRIQKMADYPYLFCQDRQPNSTYLVIPRHSSQNRKYIPIGFMDSNIIAGDACSIIPNTTKYEFGILTSNVHNAWLRIIAGRLKSDFRYSPAVYNNFPWPTPTDQQKEKIEKTAQAILDARSNYPDSSLADLYDPLLMPPDLKKAHQANDRAVMEAYGMWGKVNSESECVAWLFRMYEELTKQS